MQNLQDNSCLGRAAELLVCFDFVYRGYQAVVNSFPSAKADVFIDTGSGRVLRCQVKSTAIARRQLKKERPIAGRGCERTRVFGTAPHWSVKYRFSLGSGSESYERAGIDFFAFVALDTKTVLYLPASALENGNDRDKKSFGVNAFNALAPGSLERCLAQLGVP